MDITTHCLQSARVARRKYGLLNAVELSSAIVLSLFVVYYINLFLGGWLNALGIRPRSLWGFLGIFVSPLLHYDQAHLMTNGVSLFLLLSILFSHREYRPEAALASVWFFSGLGTWLIGRPLVHIGASGLLYGIVTYLITAAWWLRSWRSGLLAVLILILYGGIFYGVLPKRGPISWEAHLSGAIAGAAVARRQLRGGRRG